MSEDEDERMDRARRIRKMREGQRSGDDGTDPADGDDTAEDADGESTADEAPSDDGEPASASDADEAPEPDEAADPAGEPADGASADDADETDNPAPPSDQDSATTVDEAATEDDAVTAAEHAPESPGAAGDTSQPRADGAERSQEDSMNDDTSASDTDVSNGDGAPDPQAIAQRAAEAAASVGAGDTEPSQTASNGDAVEEAAAAIQGGGVELPDQEQIEAAMESAGVETNGEDDTAPAPSGVDSETTTTEESTRALEFTLGDEHYCIDISLVEEIVKRDTITRVPNTDDHIEGVVDLRGQITTILDPKELLDIDAEGSESLIIVFDPEAFEDQGAIGWLVDEVRQVAPILESEVNDPPVKEDYIRGVVDREDSDEFVIWTKPEVAITLATADDDEE